MVRVKANHPASLLLGRLKSLSFSVCTLLGKKATSLAQQHAHIGPAKQFANKRNKSEQENKGMKVSEAKLNSVN